MDQNQTIKVSIIVPVYNVEKYLEKCLESLVQQLVVSYELILVDDGSTDESPQIIERYAKNYPELINVLTVTNGGQGRARNIGIEKAHGEYIGFVDSDDWVDTTMYEKLYLAAKEQGADISMCDMTAIYPDGSITLEVQQKNEQSISAAGSACNKLFKRELVGGERFPEGLWYEDFAFSAKLLMKTEKIAHVYEPLYFYRKGHSSTMHNENAAKNLDIITVMESLQTFRESGKRDDFEHLLINHVLLDAINRVGLQEASEKRMTIRTLRKYVQRNIRRLPECESFKKENRNRKIIMFLNYYGLDLVSVFILRLKTR